MFREREALGSYLWRWGCTARFPALKEPRELPTLSLVPFSVSWKAPTFPTLDPSCLTAPTRDVWPEAPSILKALQGWQIRTAPCNCQGQQRTQRGRGRSTSGRRPAATPQRRRGAQGKMPGPARPGHKRQGHPACLAVWEWGGELWYSAP